MTNKVLIITYYWPPGGGSGVQRWLKFVKYLPQLGWTPFVFTPEKPTYSNSDDSLLKDIPKEANIVRLPIREPYDMFVWLSGLFGSKKLTPTDFVTTGKRSGFQKIASWIRGNFFIPDARIFWVKPATRFLKDFIKQNDIHTIITTGPPHSMHLIGLRLKTSDPSLQWIADFRDPWSEWDLLDTFLMTSRSRKAHRKMERLVLETADQVITISPYHVKRFEILGGRHVELITNGFDEDDFRGIEKIRTPRFVIRHTGVVDELRDPRPFITALEELCQQQPDFASHVALEFIGKVNSAFTEHVKSIPSVSAFTTFRDQMPHDDLLRLYGQTDLQLLILAHTAIAPGNLPGKFFEYMASGNPILAVGPVDGDAGAILRRTGAGEIFERSDTAGMKACLLVFFSEWQQGTRADRPDIASFARRNLTAQLVKILESRQR